nr:PREDICTED: uncharacterized protein LOC109037390 isoform X2 [Bemisia tabaci]
MDKEVESYSGLGQETVEHKNMQIIEQYASFLTTSDEKYRKIHEKAFNLEIKRYGNDFIQQILTDNDHLRKSREKLLEICRPLAQQNMEYSKQLQDLKRQCENANQMCTAWQHAKDQMYLLYKDTQKELAEKSQKLDLVEKSLSQLKRLKGRRKSVKTKSTKTNEGSSDDLPNKDSNPQPESKSDLSEHEPRTLRNNSKRIGYAESSDNDATSDEELDLCEVISAWNIKKPDEAMPMVPISSPSKKPSSCEKKSVTSNSSALGPPTLGKNQAIKKMKKTRRKKISSVKEEESLPEPNLPLDCNEKSNSCDGSLCAEDVNFEADMDLNCDFSIASPELSPTKTDSPKSKFTTPFITSAISPEPSPEIKLPFKLPNPSPSKQMKEKTLSTRKVSSPPPVQRNLRPRKSGVTTKNSTSPEKVENKVIGTKLSSEVAKKTSKSKVYPEYETIFDDLYVSDSDSSVIHNSVALCQEPSDSPTMSTKESNVVAVDKSRDVERSSVCLLLTSTSRMSDCCDSSDIINSSDSENDDDICPENDVSTAPKSFESPNSSSLDVNLVRTLETRVKSSEEICPTTHSSTLSDSSDLMDSSEKLLSNATNSSTSSNEVLKHPVLPTEVTPAPTHPFGKSRTLSESSCETDQIQSEKMMLNPVNSSDPSTLPHPSSCTEVSFALMHPPSSSRTLSESSCETDDSNNKLKTKIAVHRKVRKCRKVTTKKDTQEKDEPVSPSTDKSEKLPPLEVPVNLSTTPESVSELIESKSMFDPPEVSSISDSDSAENNRAVTEGVSTPESDENQTGNDHEVEKNIEEILHFGHESMLKEGNVITPESSCENSETPIQSTDETKSTESEQVNLEKQHCKDSVVEAHPPPVAVENFTSELQLEKSEKEEITETCESSNGNAIINEASDEPLEQAKSPEPVFDGVIDATNSCKNDFPRPFLGDIHFGAQGMSAAPTPPDDTELSFIGSPDIVTPPVSPLRNYTVQMSPPLSPITGDSPLVAASTPSQTKKNSTQKPFNVKRIHMFSPRPDDMSDCEDMLIMDLDINNEDLVEASSVQVDAGTEIREADELMDDMNSDEDDILNLVHEEFICRKLLSPLPLKEPPYETSPVRPTKKTSEADDTLEVNLVNKSKKCEATDVHLDNRSNKPVEKKPKTSRTTVKQRLASRLRNLHRISNSNLLLKRSSQSFQSTPGNKPNNLVQKHLSEEPMHKRRKTRSSPRKTETNELANDAKCEDVSDNNDIQKCVPLEKVSKEHKIEKNGRSEADLSSNASSKLINCIMNNSSKFKTQKEVIAASTTNVKPVVPTISIMECSNIEYFSEVSNSEITDQNNERMKEIKPSLRNIQIVEPASMDNHQQEKGSDVQQSISQEQISKHSSVCATSSNQVDQISNAIIKSKSSIEIDHPESKSSCKTKNISTLNDKDACSLISDTKFMNLEHASPKTDFETSNSNEGKVGRSRSSLRIAKSIGSTSVENCQGREQNHEFEQLTSTGEVSKGSSVGLNYSNQVDQSNPSHVKTDNSISNNYCNKLDSLNEITQATSTNFEIPPVSISENNRLNSEYSKKVTDFVTTDKIPERPKVSASSVLENLKKRIISDSEASSESYKSERNCLWTMFKFYKEDHCQKAVEVEDIKKVEKPLPYPNRYAMQEKVEAMLWKLAEPSENWSTLASTCATQMKNFHEKLIVNSIVNCIATDETDFNEALEPQLTSMQQLLVVFCHRLTSSHHPTLIETLLKTIEWNLFICEDRTKEVGSKGKKTKAQKARLQAELELQVQKVANLSAFFVLICKSSNNLRRCRAFIYDALYMSVNRAHLIIISVLSFWPRVLPLAKNSSECPVTMVMVYEIFSHKSCSQDDTFKVTELKNLLRLRYGYSDPIFAQITRESIIATLFSMLDRPGCVEAFVLLAKRGQWRWTASKLVFGFLFPILEDFRNKKIGETKAKTAIKIIGLVARAFPPGEAWLETKKILEYLEHLLLDSTLGGACFKEAIAVSVAQLHRSDPDITFSILSKWNSPDKKLSIEFLENVKSLFYGKALPDWYQNLSKICL